MRYVIEQVEYHGYVLALGNDLVWRAIKDGQVVAEGDRYEVEAYVQMAILAAHLAGKESTPDDFGGGSLAVPRCSMGAIGGGASRGSSGKPAEGP